LAVGACAVLDSLYKIVGLLRGIHEELQAIRKDLGRK
jgi:hypothetical protein